MKTVKIAAVGDILMWESQIQSARTMDNVYSFDNMFEEVVSLLKDTDLTIGNLETTFSGREGRYELVKPEKGWPMFNCPDELSGTLKRAGFDVLTTANNHCMDRGEEGLKRTLDVLDREGFYHTGTFSSYEHSQKELIIDVNGIKIAILAFTYETNLNPIPEDKPWMVNLISHNDMFSRINNTKKLVDLTIVCMHWGVEYRRSPAREQRILAQKCFEQGADIILGAHPHVIQPMKSKRVVDIDGIEKARFVIYSLGNFISKLIHSTIQSVIGMILNLTVTKESNGRTAITGIEYIPTWVYRNKTFNSTKYKVLPISKYISGNGVNLSPTELNEMKTAWNNVTAFLGKDFKAK